MCGIAGFVAPAGERVDRCTLERMVASVRHRGPDALGYYLDGRVGLGVARLRVIDLAGGSGQRDARCRLGAPVMMPGSERPASRRGANGPMPRWPN